MKKGFTLVELLAVIVILAIILVIAVPQINNVIKETRKNSLGSTAKLIAAKAEEKEVENDALEKTETITCEDLVKLDSNYGNCTVSKNSTTGKWEVTIVGANKFSGYTCTGTKDNMECSEGSSNTPEYVYSFDIPYYEDTYTVKPEKRDECKNWLLYDYWGYGLDDTIDEYDNIMATNICNNSDDIYGDGSNASASEWFESENPGDIISFFATELRDGTTDYTTLKYPDTNEQAQVFLRWDGNETEFSKTSLKSICTLYDNKLTCLEVGANAYETNKSKIETLFGSGNDNCYRNEGHISCGHKITPYSSDFACYAETNGSVGCQAPGYSCSTNKQSICGQGELD